MKDEKIVSDALDKEGERVELEHAGDGRMNASEIED